MLACKRGHEEVVRVLLTAGAELHQKDSRGRTARDTASKRHHESILAMLHAAKQIRLMQVWREKHLNKFFMVATFMTCTVQAETHEIRRH